MITATNLSYSAYNSNKAIVSNLSFNLKKGQTLCVAGNNGSGKTTLLHLLFGLIKPISGDLELSFLDNQEINIQNQNNMSLVMQDSNLQVLGNTPKEDILLGIKKDSPNYQNYYNSAVYLSKSFNIFDCWNIPITSLSYGQKRKLCLINSFLRKPLLLMLDEPLSGLDFLGITELRSIIKSCKLSGISCIISSHDLDPFYDLVDNILYLDSSNPMFVKAPEGFSYSLKYNIRQPFYKWENSNDLPELTKFLSS